MRNRQITEGIKVRWRSQSASFERTKEGEVVEVVPPKQRPRSKIKDPGLPRDHESYVVRARVVDGSEGQRKRTKLYWPRVNKLEVVD